MYKNIPIMVGDIMITSENPPKQEVTLPVSGQQAADTPLWWDTRYFCEWRQKLIRIGPAMMIAWAGMKIEAVAVIREVRRKYEIVDTTKLDELLKLVHIVDDFGVKNTSFFFLVSCPEGWRLKSYEPKGEKSEIKKFDTPWNEVAISSGTGENALIDALDGEYNQKSPDDFNKALGSLILASTRMWHHDITGMGPQNAFGGAYELALKQNNDLVKIDDILYATLVYSQKEKDIYTVPIFLKTNYYNDILVARVFDFRKPTNPKMRTYCVPPIDHYGEISEEDALANVPDLNASHFATYLKVESDGPDNTGSTAMHTYQLKPEGDAPDLRPIKFEYNGGPLPYAYTVRNDYIRSLLSEVVELKKMMGEPFP